MAAAASATSVKAGGLGPGGSGGSAGDLVLGVYDSNNAVTNSLEVDFGQLSNLTNGETFALSSDISNVFSTNTGSLQFTVAASGGPFGGGDLGAKEIQVTTTGTITVPGSTSSASTNINNEVVNATGSNFTQVALNPNAVSALNTDPNSFKTRAVMDNGGNYGLSSTAAPGGVLAAYVAGTIVTLYDFVGGQATATNEGTFTVLANGTSLQFNLPAASSLANQSLTAPTPTPLNIIAGATTTVSATLTNTASAGSNALAVNLSDSSNSGGNAGGTITNFSPTTASNTTVAAGNNTNVTGTFTADNAAGLGETWAITNTDNAAATTTATATGVVNIYTHAAGVLTVTSPTTVSAIAGATVNSTLTFQNNGATNDNLSIVTPGAGVTGLSGTFTGNQSVTNVNGATTAGAAGGTTTAIYSTTLLEDQTVIGATPDNQTATAPAVTITDLGHSSPSLSAATANLGFVHAGTTVATQSTTLNNAAGPNAGLQITSLTSGLSDSGSGLIAAGTGRALNAAVGTLSTLGAYSQIYTISTADDATVIGHTANSDQTFTVSGNVYSGQSVWNTNGSGSWGSLAIGFGVNWGANQGSPGLDPNFASSDTATFDNTKLSAGSSGTVTLDDGTNPVNPSLKAITFNTTGGGYTIAPGVGGKLKLNGAASAATITDTAGTQTISAPVELDSNISVTSNGTLTISGIISEAGGTRSLTVGGTGTVILTANNSYSGITTINSGGTIQFGNGGTTGSPGNGNIVDNGMALIDHSNNLSIGNLISGTGSLTQAGNDTVTLTAANLYSGGTTISAGTLQLSGSGTLGATTGTLAINGGSTLDLNGTNQTVGAVTLGTGGGTILTSSTASTLTTTGVTVSGGGNMINSNVTVTGAITQSASSALSVNGVAGSDSLANLATLSGTGTVGAVALAGNNTVSSTGTLTTSGITVGGTGNAIGTGTVTGAITQQTGSALTVSGSAGSDALGTSATLTGSGTGSVGAVTLAGSNTLNGPLTTTGITVNTNSTGNTLAGTVSGAITQNASSALTVTGTAGTDTLANLATLNGTGTVGAVTLAGNNTLSSTGTLTTSGITVGGTGNTIGTGTVAGAITQNAGSALKITGTAGNDSLANLATLSGTGTVGTVTLAGNNTLSSTGTLTTSGITVGGTGNAISTGTVTGNATLNSGAALAVNGTLSGTVAVGNGILDGTGTTGAVTVGAGGAINLQDGVIGTLTVGGLSLGNAGTPSSISFDITSGSSNNLDQINDTGSLTLTGVNGTTINIGNLSGTPTLTDGTYTLISYTGAAPSLSDLSLATTSLDGKVLSLVLGTGVLQLQVADAAGTTYNLATTAQKGRIISGQSTALTTTITNTGATDTLNFTGLQANATGVSGPSFSGGPLAKSGGQGSNTVQIFTGSATGAITISPLVISATNATLGGAANLGTTTSATVDVLDNRVVTASSVLLGRVLVNQAVSGTSTLSTTGADTNFTRVTVGTAGADANGISATGGTNPTFNGPGVTDTRTVGGAFATAGNASGTLTLTTTGEGLTGESPINVSLAYTADAVNNRTESATSVSLGRVIVGQTTGNQNTTVSSVTGQDSTLTRTTLGAGSQMAGVTNGTLTLAGGASYQFGGANDATNSTSRGVTGTFTAAGSQTGTANFTPTGEGLAGETVNSFGVAYTADAVNNRTETGTSVNLGRVIVGQTTGSQNTTVSSVTGQDLTLTRTTLGAGSQMAGVTNGTLTLASGTSYQFGGANDATNSTMRGVTGTFTAAGNQTGTANFTPTGEGLTGETVNSFGVAYTADAVNNRTENASSVSLGRVIVGQTTGSQNTTISSVTGQDSTLTRTTLSSGSQAASVTNGTVTLGSGTSYQFGNVNDAINSTSRGVTATFTAAGNQSGTASFTPTGEGLTGETVNTIGLAYTSDAVNNRTENATSVNLGRVLVNQTTGSQNTTISSLTGQDSTLTRITLAAGTQAANVTNGTVTLTNGTSYVFGGPVDDAINSTTAGVTGIFTAAGNQSGTATFTPAGEGLTGETVNTIGVAYAADAVNQRSFTVGTSPIVLGRFLVSSPPTGTTAISSSGMNAVTANATLGTFVGTNTDGLTLTTTDPTAFNGATANQTANYTIGGTATAGNLTGASFSSTVAAELGSIAPVTVSVTGDAVNKRVITNGATNNLGTLHTGAAISGTTTAFTSTTGDNSTTTSVTVAQNGTAASNGVNVTGAGTTDFSGTTGSDTRTFTGNIVANTGNSMAGVIGATTGTVNLAVTTQENGGAGLAGEGTYAPVAINYTANVYSGQSSWVGNGTNTGSWGTLASGFGANWGANQGSPGLDPGFTSTDTATFGNVSGQSTQMVTLDGASPSLNSITFSAANTSYTLASGTGGTITLNGGAGSATVTDTAGVHTISAPVSLATDTNVNVASNQQLTVSGNITGPGALTNAGAGLTILTGTDSYSGGTTITSGALLIGSGGNAGSITGNVADNAMLAFDRSDSVGFGGTISGSGSLTQLGSGTLTLSGANTFNGPVTVNNGTLSTATLAAVGTAQPLGKGGTVTLAGTSLAAPGILQYTGGAATLGQAVTVTTGDYGTISNTGGALLTVSGNISKNGSMLNFSGGSFNVTGVISGANAGSDLNVVGGSTVTLSNANTYNGPTSISAGSTLITAVAGALPAPNFSVLTLGALGDTGGQTNTLDLDGTPQTIGGLKDGGGAATNHVINSNGTAAALTISPVTGTTDTFSGALTGHLSVSLIGAGTQILNGANTYSGGTTLSSGTILAGSATALGTGNVVNNATLGASGTQHVIQVGSPPAVVVSNYSGTGTLSINLNSNPDPVTFLAATNDVLSVTGTAVLNGALAVNFVPSAAFIPTKGQTFEVVQTTGGIVGTPSAGYTTPFTTPAGTGIIVTGTESVNKNDFLITIGSTQLALNNVLGSYYTANRAAIAGAIGSNFTTGPVYAAFASIVISPAAVADALDQNSPLKFATFTRDMTPNLASFSIQEWDGYLASQRSPQGDFLAGNGQIDSSGLTMTDPSMDPGLAPVHSRFLAWDPAPLGHGLLSDSATDAMGGIDMKDMKDSKTMNSIVDNLDPWNVFIAGNVVLAQDFSQTEIPHADTTTGGVQLGIDFRITPHLRVGALFGYGHTDADLDNNGSKATADTFSPGIYASYANSGWYVNALGSYGFDNFTEDRHIAFGGLSGIAQGAPSGKQVVADLDGGYDFHVKNWTFGPTSGIQYTHLTVDSFSENGFALLDQNVNRTETDSLRSRLGAHASYPFHTGTVLLTPHLNASWQHEFLDQSRGITSQFTGGLGVGSFNVNTPDPSRDSALIDFGIDADLNGQVTLFLDYLAQLGQSDYFGQSVQAGVKIGF